MQYVFITGVSSGIGYVTARYLASHGFRIIGSVRKSQDAFKLKNELGDKFIPVVFDVCDQDAISQAVLEVEDLLGTEGLYALINNAGIAVSGPLEHIPLNDFSHQLEVNVTSVLRITQALLPLLGTDKKKYTHAGRIINIGSISGVITRPFVGPYSASKHALEALTDALRRELYPVYGIKVILIQAGPIKTPIWSKAKKEGNSYQDTVYNYILKDRNKLIDKTEQMALEPVVLAKLIYKILTTRNPKPRYMPTNNKLMIQLIAYFFPDRLNDWLFGRIINNYLKSQAIDHPSSASM